MSSKAGNGEGQHPASGRVVAGVCELEVGTPGGSRLILIEPSAQRPTKELSDALGPSGSELRAPTDFLKGVVEDGSKAADAVDHSVALLQAAARGGEAVPATIKIAVDTVLKALSYFDHERRFEDEIELARTVADLIALLQRWWELVETLLHAFDGAKHLATSQATDQVQGWVLHELGSLSTCADRPSRARELLNRAKTARERIQDHQGVAATNQNLALTGTRIAPLPPRPPRWRPTGRQWCGIGAVAVALAGIASGAVVEHQVDHSSPPLPAISLVITHYGPTSLAFKGTAETDSTFNDFVDVRVYKMSHSPLPRFVEISPRSHVSPDGTFQGTIKFSPRLKGGYYFAEARQGLVDHQGRELSGHESFFVKSQTPATPATGTLTITPFDQVQGTPFTISGTSTNLERQYVVVFVYPGPRAVGVVQDETSAVQIGASGDWKATATGSLDTPYENGGTYTAQAVISDAGGTVPADTVISDGDTFTWTEASPPEGSTPSSNIP